MKRRSKPTSGLQLRSKITRSKPRESQADVQRNNGGSVPRIDLAVPQVRGDLRPKGDTDAPCSRGRHLAAVADRCITILALQPRLGLLPKRRPRPSGHHSLDSVAIRILVKHGRNTPPNRSRILGALFARPKRGRPADSKRRACGWRVRAPARPRAHHLRFTWRFEDAIRTSLPCHRL